MPSLSVPHPGLRVLLVFTILLLRARAGLTPEEIATALDSGDSIAWRSSAAVWSLVTGGQAHDGTDALRTPALPHSKSEELAGTVEGPGVLRGWIRVSSEKYHDALTVALDGATLAEFSGQDQGTFEINVARGAHEVRLSWAKDATRVEGSDAAWLDEVIFTSGAVSVEEALDVAGTPAAPRIVFANSDGVLAWRGVADANGAHLGGDALYSSARSSSGEYFQRTLRATVNQPSLVTFWSRAINSFVDNRAGSLEVKPEGTGQVLDSASVSGWTRWRVLLPATGDSLRLEHGNGNASGNAVGDGYYLDDWTVEPLAPVSIAEALDAPGLTFAADWGNISHGTAGNAPWRELAASGAAAGVLTYDGTDALVTQPLTRTSDFINPFGARQLSTTVTGPGRMSFWWKRTGVVDGQSAAAGVVTAPATNPANERALSDSQPVRSEWQQVTMEVPPGAQRVQWRWSAGSEVLMLDRFVWTPTPVAAPAPAVADALDLSGSVNISSTGNWSPVGWNGSGLANDDTLTWQALAGATGDGPPLAASVNGAGWVSFGWRLLGYEYLRFDTDGVSEWLFPVTSLGGAYQGDRPWQQVARRLPAGNHTLAWRPNATASTFGDGRVRLDALRFMAAPPSWVDALDSSGIDDWQQGRAPWTTVTDVTHDGTDALRTPVVGAEDYVALAAKITGPGTLRFWWRMDDPAPQMDSSGNYSGNRAVFRGTAADAILTTSGTWQEVVAELSSQYTYDLRWSFHRSARATLPGDGLWIDEVSFTKATAVSMAAALDAPGLTWTWQGPFTALGGAGFSQARGNAVMQLPAEVGFPLPEVWLQTTVPGPGLVEIKYNRGQGSPPFELWVDGAKLERLGDQYNPAKYEVYGAGPHVCRLMFPSRYELVELDYFSYTPLQLVTLAEALDLPPAPAPERKASVIGLRDATAAHDGADAVLMDTTGSYEGRAELKWKLSAPARVSFWWRGEGAADGSAAANSYPGGPGSHKGPFAWEENTAVISGFGDSTFIIIADDGPTQPYKVWVDQVRIEPFAVIPPAEALHLSVGTVTTGGDGQWRCFRPPGAAGAEDGAYAAAYLSNGSVGPVWLEALVTGPALLHYHLEYNRQDSFNRLTVTRTPAAGGAAAKANSDGPLAIPPGEHLVRWSMLRDYGWYSPDAVMSLTGVRMETPKEVAPQLGLPGLTFTSTSSPEGFWYGDNRAPHDSTVFSDDTLVRVGGSAILETTLTGPGWLLFEAEMAPQVTAQSWPAGSGMEVRLLPPGPDPDPLPAPVLALIYSGHYFGQVRTEPVAQNVWIPAGPWRLQFIGRNAATLNNFRFIPGLDATSAAAALDLPQGVLASFPSNKGGAVASPVKHDGSDALQLLAGEPSQNPLLSLTFTGPAVVSGWLRNGRIKPDVWSADFEPANAPEPGVVWNENRYGLHVFQNGQRLGVPEEDAISPGEWSPLRIVVPAGGPQVISFGLANTASGELPDYVLQIDELEVTPLSLVTLGEALDAPGLTWTAAPQSWSGGASAIASPDGTDAAWVVAREDTLGWLETTVTGPGALRFWSWGGGSLDLTIGGLPQPAIQATSFEGTDSRWRSHVVPVPQGTHAVRIEPADWEWFGETALFGLDHMEWEPGAVTTLTAALDVPAGAALTTGGPEAANWTGTAVAAHSHDGADAVSIRAPLTDRAWLDFPVTGPAIVSFWQAVGDSARLTFTMDDAPVRIPSIGGGGGIIIIGNAGGNPRGARDVDAPDVPQPGRSEWHREEFAVPAGTHTLRWSVGEDSPQPLPGEVLFTLDELTIAPLPAPLSLAEALDVPEMTLTTNFSDKIFAVAVAGMAHDGVDCAVVTGTGRYEEADQARLTLTVPGPGLVRYRWRPLGTSDFPRPQVRVPGLAQEYVMHDLGEAEAWEDWREAWLVQPLSGPRQVTWQVERENHGFVMDDVSFASLPGVAAATGAPELTWSTGSGSSWIGLPQLTQSERIKPAAASSMVPQGQTGWIGTQLQGPGRLTFTASKGLLLFNGLALYTYDYNENAHTLVVPPGSHELRWQADGPAPLSLSSVRWVPSATVDPIADALDASELPWLFRAGFGTWTAQSTETTDGQDALRYTGVDGVTEPWIKTVLPLPGLAGAMRRPAGRFNTTGAEPVWAAWEGGLAVPGPRIVILSAWTNTNLGPGTVDFDAFHYTPAPVSLAEALDAPGLVWETSAELPFVGYASTDDDLAFDSTDAVIARHDAPGAWLQTTVTGPARIEFFASGTGGVFTVNGSPPPQDYDSDWVVNRFEVGAGQHVLRWLKVGRNHWGLDAFSVSPFAVGNSLADALDHPGPWRVPTESVWTPSTTDTAGGPDAALFTTAYYYHPLELFVQGPGRLEFDARMSPYNHGSVGAQSLVSAPFFYSQAYFTGAWQHFVIDGIPPGAQALQWHLHSVPGTEPPAGLDAVSFTPYAIVPLSAALDAADLTVSTNPDAPWSGYAAGIAAADGSDAAISSASLDSWLDIDAPPGAGELSFIGRAPGVSFGRPPDVHGPELAMPDGTFLRLPQQWKRMRTSITADSPRPLRINAGRAAYFWIDDLKWRSAAESLAAWFAMHNLPANSDMNSDADGDGQPLVFEYAFGLDPNAHDARDSAAPAEAAMPVFDYSRYPNASSYDPSVLRCRYLRRSGGSGLRYEVFFSNDLGPLPEWTENYFTVTTELNDEWQSVAVYDHLPGWTGAPEKRFGRVRVSYEP